MGYIINDTYSLPANKGEHPEAVRAPLVDTSPRYPIPLLIFTYNRPEYLERALNSLFKYVQTVSRTPFSNFLF